MDIQLILIEIFGVAVMIWAVTLTEEQKVALGSYVLDLVHWLFRRNR